MIAQNQTLKIFLIDDDPKYIKKQAENLSKTWPQANITTFLSSETCLGSLHENPDVIFLGYDQYNYENYPEATDKLSLIDSCGEHVKIIVTSKEQDKEIEASAREKGAYEYVQKDQEIYQKSTELVYNIMKDKEEQVLAPKVFYTRTVIALAFGGVVFGLLALFG